MKLQRISGLQHESSFLSSTENPDLFHQSFLESDLGRIHSAIPWEMLVKEFGLVEFNKGPDSFLVREKGKLALMFLKHHACCSDNRLIEQLNSNIDFQFFCDLHFGLNR